MKLRNRAIAFIVTIAMVLNNILSPVSVWYGEQYALAAESRDATSSSASGQTTGKSGASNASNSSPGTAASSNQPATPLVLKKSVTAGKEPAPGEPDTRRTYAVQVTCDASAGVPEGAELEVSEIEAKDEQKKTAREQLKLAENDRVVAETYIRVVIKDGDSVIQPVAPVDVVVETASMAPTYSDAVEAVVLGEKDTAVTVENLTGKRDDGTEDEKPTTTKLRLKTDRLGDFALATVVTPFDTRSYDGQTIAMLGPRAKHTTADEVLYDGHEVDGGTLLRTVTFRTEPEHAWHPTLWAESRIAQGHGNASSSVVLRRWEGGTATAQVLGTSGGLVAFASDGEIAYVLEKMRPVEAQPVEELAHVAVPTEEHTPSAAASQNPTQQQATPTQVANEGTTTQTTRTQADVTAETEAEVEALEQTYTASDGRTYRVTVSASDEADVPVNAELAVSEIARNSAEYLSYAARATNALGVKPDAKASVRALDIKLKDPVSSKELQPAEDVKVSVELLGEDPSGYANVGVVHMRGNHDGGRADPRSWPATCVAWPWSSARTGSRYMSWCCLNLWISSLMCREKLWCFLRAMAKVRPSWKTRPRLCPTCWPGLDS